MLKKLWRQRSPAEKAEYFGFILAGGALMFLLTQHVWYSLGVLGLLFAILTPLYASS